MLPRYLLAEIHESDLAGLRLVADDGAKSVLAVADGSDGAHVAIFFRRRDVARLLFGGQRERIAFVQTAAYVGETMRLADVAERRLLRARA